MLILTRRIGEALVVGEDIRFTVLGVKGNQVRIGIAAPKDVSVHREEIFLKILDEQDVTNSSPDFLSKFTVRGKKSNACTTNLTH